jgi:hypothetical protein
MGLGRRARTHPADSWLRQNVRADNLTNCDDFTALVIDETAARVVSAARGGSCATILLRRVEADESAARQLFGVIDAVFCKLHYPCHDQVDVPRVCGTDDFPHVF